jgi:hypothetical protein
MKQLLMASAIALTLSGCVAHSDQGVYHRPVYGYTAPNPFYRAPPVVVVRPVPYYYRPYRHGGHGYGRSYHR